MWMPRRVSEISPLQKRNQQNIVMLSSCKHGRIAGLYACNGKWLANLSINTCCKPNTVYLHRPLWILSCQVKIYWFWLWFSASYFSSHGFIVYLTNIYSCFLFKVFFSLGGRGAARECECLGVVDKAKSWLLQQGEFNRSLLALPVFTMVLCRIILALLSDFQPMQSSSNSHLDKTVSRCWLNEDIVSHLEPLPGQKEPSHNFNIQSQVVKTQRASFPTGRPAIINYCTSLS